MPATFAPLSFNCKGVGFPDTTVTKMTPLKSVPLYFLHGTFGAPSDWASAFDALRDIHPLVGQRIQALALPGHDGRQPKPEPSLWDQIIADIYAQLRSGPCVFVGYSLGGRALLAAIAQSEPKLRQNILALALEGVHPGLVDARERAERANLDRTRAAELRAGDSLEFLRRWYTQPIFGALAQDPQAREALAQHRAQGSDRDALARVIEECSPGIVDAQWETLTSLEIPILYIAGQQDAKYLALARQLQTLAPQITIAPIEGAGHNAHLDAPRAFAEALDRFLRTHALL